MIKIQKIHLLQFCQIVILFVAFFFFNLAQLVPYTTIAFRMCLLSTLLSFVIILNSIRNKYTDKLILLWTFLFLFPSLFNYSLLSGKVFLPGYFLAYISIIFPFLMLLALSKSSFFWIKWANTGLFIFSLLQVVITILCFIFPAFYFAVILPKLPQELWPKLIQYSSENIITGLGNHYSVNGIFMAVAMIVFFSYKSVFNKKYLYSILFFISILSILLSAKRMPLIAAAVAIFLVNIIFSNKKNKGVFLLKSFAVILSFVVIIWGLSFFNESIAYSISRLQMIGDSDDSSTNTRLILYSIAWNWFLESPIIGNGWGAFLELLRNNYSGASMIGVETHVHNVYFQLLCETGIIGASLFISAFFWTLVRTIKIVNYIKTISLKDSPILLGMHFSLGMQIYFLIYCMTGNPLYDKTIYIYAIACAIPLAISKRIRV